jgi:hypothetical protein
MILPSGESAFVSSFHTRGFAVVRGALPARGVALLRREVERGLLALGDASVSPSLDVRDARTWPPRCAAAPRRQPAPESH